MTERTAGGKTDVLVCGRCGRRARSGLAFEMKAPGGDTLRCLRCVLRHWTMLRRSLVVAAVVGTTLTLLNQGDLLLTGQLSWQLAWKVPLTYLVPFCVATFGALSNARR